MDMQAQFKLMNQKGGDVVIIGGGASGMAAAIAARQKGAPCVTIVEESGALGGNAVYAPVPSLTPPPDPEAEAHADYLQKMADAHWIADGRIVRTLCDQMVKIPAWLSAFAGEAGEGQREGRLAALMENECLRLGVHVRRNCAALRIIQDEDGWTTGVEVKENEKIAVVPAAVAVVATGGMLGDVDMMKKYIPYMDDRFLQEAALAGRSYSSAGVRLALDLGAGDQGTVTMQWCEDPMPFAKHPLTDSIAKVAASGRAMWVNNVGVRYCNEGVVDSTANVARQPGKESFIVTDEGILEAIAKRQPDFSIAQFKKDLEPLIDADQALVCRSFNEMAAWIRGKAHITAHAFERYNECCAAGRDFLFGKDPELLTAFEKPPFYVLRSGFPVVMTHGPVKVNPMMSCVTLTDFPVRGVLACGGVLGGLYSEQFISTRRADSLRVALASGMLAGDHAAAFVGGGRPAPKFEFPKFSAREVMAGDYYNVGMLPNMPQA